MELSIALRATKSKIIDILNQSGLPIDVIVYMLHELQEKTAQQAEQEYKTLLRKEAEREEAELAKQEAREAEEVQEKQET